MWIWDTRESKGERWKKERDSFFLPKMCIPPLDSKGPLCLTEQNRSSPWPDCNHGDERGWRAGEAWDSLGAAWRGAMLKVGGSTWIPSIPRKHQNLFKTHPFGMNWGILRWQGLCFPTLLHNTRVQGWIICKYETPVAIWQWEFSQFPYTKSSILCQWRIIYGQIIRMKWVILCGTLCMFLFHQSITSWLLWCTEPVPRNQTKQYDGNIHQIIEHFRKMHQVAFLAFPSCQQAAAINTIKCIGLQQHWITTSQ